MTGKKQVNKHINNHYLQSRQDSGDQERSWRPVWLCEMPLFDAQDEVAWQRHICLASVCSVEAVAMGGEGNSVRYLHIRGATDSDATAAGEGDYYRTFQNERQCRTGFHSLRIIITRTVVDCLALWWNLYE